MRLPDPRRGRDPLADTDRLVKRVYSYVSYTAAGRVDADDVTGETFLRAVRYRDSFDPAKGSPVEWVLGIARRCVADALAGEGTVGDPPDIEAPGDLAQDAVNRVGVREALLELSDRDRELVALRYGADLKSRQIAAQLGMKTNAVEVALHRALARLRPLLDEDRPRHPADTSPR